MITIKISPQANDNPVIAASIDGTVLTVNGTTVDLAEPWPVHEDGFDIPPHEYLIGRRQQDGDIAVTLIWPYKASEHQEVEQKVPRMVVVTDEDGNDKVEHIVETIKTMKSVPIEPPFDVFNPPVLIDPPAGEIVFAAKEA